MRASYFARRWIVQVSFGFTSQIHGEWRSVDFPEAPADIARHRGEAAATPGEAVEQIDRRPSGTVEQGVEEAGVAVVRRKGRSNEVGMPSERPTPAPALDRRTSRAVPHGELASNHVVR